MAAPRRASEKAFGHPAAQEQQVSRNRLRLVILAAAALAAVVPVLAGRNDRVIVADMDGADAPVAVAAARD